MNSGIILDTNIIVSGLVYGGLPKEILTKILEKDVVGVTSLPLIAEAIRILGEKFNFFSERIEEVQEMFKEHFLIVYPKQTIKIVRDEPDNRVLEAAIEGNCEFVVTGDKDLLTLGHYRGVKIVTAKEFKVIFV